MNQDAKAEVLRVAAGIVRGEIEMVDGARFLVRRFGDAGLRNDPDAVTIVGFESETDNLPVGSQRAYWNPDALVAKDAQREAYVARVGATVLAACQALVEKLRLDNLRQ